MKFHLKLLLAATYLLLLHQTPVTSHKHKKEEDANKEEGTKKDIVTPAVSLAASMASTYLLNWLKKTKSVLANINNLSKDYLIFEECEGKNVEIPVVPTDLVPGKLGTEMGTFNPAGVFKNMYSKLTGANLWVRCAWETHFKDSEHFKNGKPGYNPRSKIVFLVSLRGSKSGGKSKLAIAMCTNDEDPATGKPYAIPGCDKFESIEKMKKAMEEYEKDPNLNGKNIRVATFEKEQGFIQKPIYYCHKDVACVSASMGNGGNAVAQVYVHNYVDEDKFTPIVDPTVK